MPSWSARCALAGQGTSPSGDHGYGTRGKRAHDCRCARANILQPYDDDTSRERISASGPDVSVGAKAVTSLALALHESATNAVKYGALSEPNGAIRIKWETHNDDFRLQWEETGGPAIFVTSKRHGFGSVLTERSIVDQLGGKIEYDWQRTGSS